MDLQCSCGYALRIVEVTSSSRFLALEKLLLRDDSAHWVSLSPVIAVLTIVSYQLGGRIGAP